MAQYRVVSNDVNNPTDYLLLPKSVYPITVDSLSNATDLRWKRKWIPAFVLTMFRWIVGVWPFYLIFTVPMSGAFVRLALMSIAKNRGRQ